MKQKFLCKNSDDGLECEKLIVVQASSDCRSADQCLGRFCIDDCGNDSGDCFDLPYLDISDDQFADPSQAIYHQYIYQEDFTTAAKLMEVQGEHVVPVNRVIKGTEADKRSKVYGYKNVREHGSRSDQIVPIRIDLEGGRAKAYDKQFKNFFLKYNGASSAEFADDGLNQENTLKIIEPVLSYFMERGFTMAPPDVPSKFTDQFIWTLGAGQYQHNTELGYVAMRLIYNKDCDRRQCEDPQFVDLVATASTTTDDNQTGVNATFYPQSFVLETYEPNPLAHRNGRGYPLRIPITRDFCKFSVSTEPIAYYDKDCDALTVNVPFNEAGYLYYSELDDTGNPANSIDIQDYLQGFFGTFKLLKRDCSVKDPHRYVKAANVVGRGGREGSQLVPSKAREAQVLAQISEFVYIQSFQITQGNGTSYEVELPIRTAFNAPDDETTTYTGVVLPLMNSTTASFDVYAVPYYSINSYAVAVDPTDLPAEDGAHGIIKHLEGDNPLSRAREQYSTPSSMTLWSNPLWSDVVYGLDKDIMNGKSCPEKISRFPRLRRLEQFEAMRPVAGHEFMHNVQYATGVISLLPAEAMAAGIEADTRINQGAVILLRCRAIAQRNTRFTRGDFTMMRSDDKGSSTYGALVFWKYLADQWDHNYQIPRLIMDILSQETAGPLFRANDFPTTAITNTANNTGANVAMKLALKRYKGVKIADLWFDFSVSITMFRNNKAIPKQYRHSYPYWIFNTQYQDFPIIAAAETLLYGAGSQTADWWEMLDTNQAIRPGWAGAYIGETVIRTLGANFTGSCKNYHSFSFNVDHATNEIDVQITQGKWRVMVFQFTPSDDGDCDGSWIQDGPHTLRDGDNKIFEIANHRRRYSTTGNIRLVCANVTKMTGDGTELEDYFGVEPDTGSIIINSL